MPVDSSPTQYYPYRKQANSLFSITWFACFGAICVFLGISSSSPIFFTLGVIFLTGALFLWRYNSSLKDIYVDFNNDELVCFDRGESSPQYRPIIELQYIYLARSVKGHSYLIFSMRSLSSEHQRRLATQCSLKSRILIEDYIIIYLDTSKQAATFMSKVATQYPGLVKESDEILS